MPRRDDIHTILVLGCGPIVIGQAGEFDYSGTQACKALREEGYRVVLVNSNPATIMTDPETADLPEALGLLEVGTGDYDFDLTLPAGRLEQAPLLGLALVYLVDQSPRP